MAETLIVDRNIIASRIMHLQQQGIILYTVDVNPTRDYFQDWAYDVIGAQMRIGIEKIKVLAQFAFLIVVTNHEEQKKILMEQFLSMHGLQNSDGYALDTGL